MVILLNADRHTRHATMHINDKVRSHAVLNCNGLVMVIACDAFIQTTHAMR
jgi:hypothetical protein